jgi:integrase
MEKEILKMWYTRRNLSKGTQRIYEVVIEDYKNYTQKSLEQLINEAEDEEECGIRMRKRNIMKDLVGFKAELESRGYAPGTIKNQIAGLISFYKAFDIHIPSIHLPEGDIGLEQNQGKLLTREEIKAMIDVANTRDKALIYLLALSGMSQAEARHLTVKKFLDSASEAINKEIPDLDKFFEYENKILDEIITLNVVREKVHYRYQTFIPPEATKAIIAYLKERKNNRNEKKTYKRH